MDGKTPDNCLDGTCYVDSYSLIVDAVDYNASLIIVTCNIAMQGQITIPEGSDVTIRGGHGRRGARWRR